MTDLDAYLPAIAAGDADAFGRWMAGAEMTVRDSLRGFAAAVDTEAVLQEALLRVWQVAPRVQPDGKDNSLLRLALRIARNLAISEARRLRTASAYRDDLSGRASQRARERDAAPRPPDPMLRELIAACRERLPARPAQALAARLSGGGSVSDSALASALAMTVNTFLQNFTRARKLLARCLAERGVDLEVELA